MRRYFIKTDGSGVIIQRTVVDSATVPTGMTEVTQAQYEGMHDSTRVYAFSGGVITPTGANRPPVWDGTPSPINDAERDVAYLD